MASSNAATPAPAVSGNGRRDVEMLGGSRNLNSPNFARDQRLMSLDFLGEVGDSFVTIGAAICAAAAVENVVVLELALRQARSTLLEGIAEFKAIAPGGADQ